MPYHYTDPTREQDLHALPNIETFQVTAAAADVIRDWYDAAQELARDQLKPEEMP